MEHPSGYYAEQVDGRASPQGKYDILVYEYRGGFVGVSSSPRRVGEFWNSESKNVYEKCSVLELDTRKHRQFCRDSDIRI